MRDARVLIIDDSLTIRAVVEELLGPHPEFGSFAFASDVYEARSLIRTFRPMLMTLDLNMPGVDGMILLDDLRNHPFAPTIVVLSSSTIDGSEAAKAALAAGADACFDKNRILRDSAAFIRVVRKAANSRHSRARLADRHAART